MDLHCDMHITLATELSTQLCPNALGCLVSTEQTMSSQTGIAFCITTDSSTTSRMTGSVGAYPTMSSCTARPPMPSKLFTREPFTGSSKLAVLSSSCPLCSRLRKEFYRHITDQSTICSITNKPTIHAEVTSCPSCNRVQKESLQRNH